MTPERQLATRACAYAALGDLIPLYPLYALLFAEHGLSVAEISSLLALWSVTGFVLEVPSGVVADAVSRRLLLTIAPLLSGTAFALWVIAPSYEVFALGFVLWGAQGALTSGAYEALVYEELEHLSAADRYASLMGRATACSTLASAVAMGLGAPLVAVGGFAAAGAVSAAACAAAAVVGSRLPEHRGARGSGGEDEPEPSAAEALRDGTRAVRRLPALRAAVLAAAVVYAIWGSLDEYLPLLAAESGLDAAEVAIAFLAVYAAMSVGGALAGRLEQLTQRQIAAGLAVAAVALAVGALTREPVGLAAIAASFGLFQALTVVLDARVQAAIEGRARATVTSLAGLLTEVVVLAVFGLYGLGAAWASHAVLFACFAAVYLVVAALMARR
ncbi:MAG TPA: MFS transporter [Capillimicrobium sp.]